MLNPEQQLAVDFREGVCALVAGPGSGKTRVLTERYQALLNEGVWPHDILSLTFTKEAADNMRKRAKASKDEFCTFHSLGYRIVRKEKGEQLIEPELQHRLMSKLSRKWRRDYKIISQFISHNKRNAVSTDAADGDYALVHAYREYETERLLQGWIDFDSLLADSVTLLQDPIIRERHQYRYCMSDEMQDSENCQITLLRLLSEKHGNLFCVGDENQSIYGFRNAITKFSDTMTGIWPETKVLYLTTNYRSHGKIVDYLKRKAAHQNPVIQNMTAARGPEGPDIEYRQFLDDFEEAEDTLVNASQSKAVDNIILARTNRQLMPFVTLCQQQHIPFRLLGRSGFWKRNEIQKAIKALAPYKGMAVPLALPVAWSQIEGKYQVDDRTREDNDALENLKALLQVIKKFSRMDEFLNFANRATHAEQLAEKFKSGITISTIHQAKGTEYKNVYVIGCREGMMPHDKGEPVEERRIFFVGISRPKDYLRISYVGHPGAFIRPDLTPEVLERMQSAEVKKFKKEAQ